MARDSKKKIRDRKQRRANNQQMLRVLQNNMQLRQTNEGLRQAIQRATQQSFQAKVILLAVVGQAGGTLTFTKGTLQQVQEHLADYDFQIDPVKDDPENYTVTVVEAATEPNASITPVQVEPVGPETQTKDLVPEETQVVP